MNLLLNRWIKKDLSTMVHWKTRFDPTNPRVNPHFFTTEMARSLDLEWSHDDSWPVSVRGLVVMIVACQVMDPGSIPGERNPFFMEAIPWFAIQLPLNPKPATRWVNSKRHVSCGHSWYFLAFRRKFRLTKTLPWPWIEHGTFRSSTHMPFTIHPPFSALPLSRI
jgi:hypothetical protein